MVTDPQTHTPTNKPTDRIDYNTLFCMQCNKGGQASLNCKFDVPRTSRHFHVYRISASPGGPLGVFRFCLLPCKAGGCMLRWEPLSVRWQAYHQPLMPVIPPFHFISSPPSIWPALCGLRGCKNGPAPFPGRMSYKATKPGLVCLSYLSMLYYCIVVY